MLPHSPDVDARAGTRWNGVVRALLVFDKFKDSLTAEEACAAAAQGIKSAQPDCDVDECPLTDGGEGFAEILTRAAGGELHSITVSGPRESPVTAHYGIVNSAAIPAAARTRLELPLHARRVAIVEMAQASGLALLAAHERDVWKTSTIGTGQLLVAAWKAGADCLLLGVGGSATNDLGLGALAALGIIPTADPATAVLPPVPRCWDEIRQLNGKVWENFPPIRIACDVDNPLLGPCGCAAVYGPQKGLLPEDFADMEKRSARISGMLCELGGRPIALRDAPGAGAAGGIAFGLMAVAGAKLLPGFDLVSAWLDLDRRLNAADVVITGEGRFDESSLAGKGPGAIALRGVEQGKPVHVFAGQISTAGRPGLALHAITQPGTPLAAALAAARHNLTETVRRTFETVDG